MGNPNQYDDVILGPLLTEKSSKLQGLRNEFRFEVAATANKSEIKKAVETLFSVKVLKVNVSNVPGKARRVFGRPGETKPWKKAVVTLSPGETIDVS
jgi:large subunit ribosomal protein L23